MSYNAFEGPTHSRLERENPLEAFYERHKDAMHRRAEEALRRSQVSMDDFGDLYDVNNDKAYVEGMEEKFKNDAQNNPQIEESRKLAEILEAIILEWLQLGNWVGNNVKAEKTSSYDDIKNGVDIILDLDPHSKDMPTRILGLGIDVTFSLSGVQKKIDRIFENLRHGKLGKIKYYKSEPHAFRGELDRLPLVALGIDARSAKELAALWYQDEKERLAQHPMRHRILTQCLDQLTAMQHVASMLPDPDKKIEHAIERIRNPIRTLVMQQGSRRVAESGEDMMRGAVKEALERNLKE